MFIEERKAKFIEEIQTKPDDAELLNLGSDAFRGKDAQKQGDRAL